MNSFNSWKFSLGSCGEIRLRKKLTDEIFCRWKFPELRYTHSEYWHWILDAVVSYSATRFQFLTISGKVDDCVVMPMISSLHCNLLFRLVNFHAKMFASNNLCTFLYTLNFSEKFMFNSIQFNFHFTLHELHTQIASQYFIMVTVIGKKFVLGKFSYFITSMKIY